MTPHWGSGEVASADGMRFVAPASAIHAGPNPKYYGQARGVSPVQPILAAIEAIAAHCEL